MAEKNHTLPKGFIEKKIVLFQKHDEVTRFDGTFQLIICMLKQLITVPLFNNFPYCNSEHQPFSLLLEMLF